MKESEEIAALLMSFCGNNVGFAKAKARQYYRSGGVFKSKKLLTYTLAVLDTYEGR